MEVEDFQSLISSNVAVLCLHFLLMIDLDLDGCFDFGHVLALSALPIFPSTFMPGHGPSRHNHQDQDQS